jgi:hypothetical protein
MNHSFEFKIILIITYFLYKRIPLFLLICLI